MFYPTVFGTVTLNWVNVRHQRCQEYGADTVAPALILEALTSNLKMYFLLTVYSQRLIINLSLQPTSQGKLSSMQSSWALYLVEGKNVNSALNSCCQATGMEFLITSLYWYSLTLAHFSEHRDRGSAWRKMKYLNLQHKRLPESPDI